MKYELKLSRKHPNGEMRLGKHKIVYEEKVYDLDEDELKKFLIAKTKPYISGRKVRVSNKES